MRRERPDVVVMDIRMPVLDGLEATRLIAADPQLSSVRVLVLTTFEIDEYVFDALRAGAGSFLLKDAEPTELLRAIRVVAAGDSLLSGRHTARYRGLQRPAGANRTAYETVNRPHRA